MSSVHSAKHAFLPALAPIRAAALAVALALAFSATAAAEDSPIDWGEWADATSAETRVEQRDSFGGRLVHGTETLGTPDGSAATPWDTTATADGWHTQTSSDAPEHPAQSIPLAIVNTATVAIEEGRLTANTTWTSAKLHLVRNSVVVPSGVKLTIVGGTTVKLTEDTSIVVEDGGELVIQNGGGNDVHFALAENDSIGGDTDMRPPADAPVSWPLQAVYAFSSATVSGGSYVPVSLNDAQVFEQEGKAFVPVTFTGTRNAAFSVDWVVEEGSAKFGTDYTLAAGTLTWAGTADGTRYIEIPLAQDAAAEPAKTFKVRIVTVRGANAVLPVATVTLLDAADADMELATTTSAPTRADLRTSFGGRLTHGTQTLGAPDGGAPTAWDTTQVADGWHNQTSGGESAQTVALAVVNAATIAIEEGRLAANATWASDKLHLLRNNVVVPSGVKLTIAGGSIVKLTEDTSIVVEDGGVLEIQNGGEGATDVHFALAENDSVGGDTDMRPPAEAPVSWLLQAVYAFPAATVPGGTYISVSLNDAQAVEKDGKAFIPVTFSGTRNATFSIDWIAEDGVAKFGEDYTTKSGTVTWTGTAQGTKYIEIPLVSDEVQEGEETFTVRIVATHGANVARASATVTIIDTEESWGVSGWADSTSAPVRVDLRESFGGRLTHGAETLGDPEGGAPTPWDTTQVADGWHNQTSGGESAQTVALAVLNAPEVAIEEGRLAASTTWASDKLHLLRNNVVVPSGVKLTIVGGTIVKLTEDTSIVVEDGGVLEFQNSGEGGVGGETDVHFALAENDSVGGDTDMRPPADAPVSWGLQAVYAFPAATVPGGAYISVSLNNAQVLKQDGTAFVPVTFGGTRNAAFSVDWEAVSDAGVVLASGTLAWTGTSQGTRYIAIPLATEDGELPANFTVRIVAGRGVNVAQDVATAAVTVLETPVTVAVTDWADASSAPTRVDQRTSFGGRLTHGAQTLGDPDGAAPTAWDTTQVADGWHNQTSGEQTVALAVVNAGGVVIEEGRLTANTTWAAGVTHLLRNSVVVPNGVKLTIVGGSIVKLTEDTSIVVEDGGVLEFQNSGGGGGAGETDVHFALAENDSVGGDTDMRPPAEAPVSWLLQAVYAFPAATIPGGAFVPVSLNDAQVFEQEGKAFVPVTFTGTRNAAFSIDWVAEEGSAKFGTDYTLASGTLTWTGTTQGTRYIEIPLVVDADVKSPRNFRVRVVTVRGVNAVVPTADVTVLDSAVTVPVDSDASAPARVDLRESYGGRLVRGVQTIGTPDGSATSAWDTTQVADGWHNQAAGGQTVALAVRNAANILFEEGRLTADATWTPNVLRIVRNYIVVPSGVTLTISAGTIVKFTEDTGIIVETGGSLIANGAIFTHIADDTAGGDTNGDGNRTIPVNDEYTIEGEGQISLSPDCELRHKTIESGGTLSANQTWQGNRVYYIKNDIIIPNNVALTIGEGAIVKFETGKRITVNAGGTLRVNGTANNKVVFTSIKDDTHGGDTNGDGKNSAPSIGDWKSLVIKGHAELVHSQFLYGGDTTSGSWNQNEAGVVTWLSGSTGLMDSCIILDGKFEGIISFALGLLVKNTIIAYCDRAVNSLGGDTTLINCTLHSFSNSLVALAHGGALSMTNTIFTNVTGSFFYSNVSVKNCILWNPLGYGPQSESHAGQNGNRWADPLFQNPETGNFTLKAGSPAIDAGDGTVAPERDYFGQERINDPFVVQPQGIASEKGVYPDIGAFEFMNLNAQSDFDLAAVSITGTESTVAGENLRVVWNVTNVGSKTISGSWVDSIYITSVDPAISAQNVKLGNAVVSATLQPGESAQFESVFRLPSVQSGSWAYMVVVNENHNIFEGALVENNTIIATSTLNILAPTIPSGNTNVSVPPGGESIYQLGAIPESGAVIFLSEPSIEAFVARGYAPSTSRYDYKTIDIGSGALMIIIPSGAGTNDFYLSLKNTGTVQANLSVDIQPLTLKLYSIGTRGIGNTGKYVISLTGTKMDTVSSVSLSSGGTQVSATLVQHLSQTEIAAHFELSGITAGAYDVRVADSSGSTSTLAGALMVNGVQIAQGEFYARMEMPPSTRANREQVAYFVYGNSGTAEMPAPHVTIRPGWTQTTNAATSVSSYTPDPTLFLRLSQSDSWQNSDVVIMAVSEKYPVSALKAGEERRVPIFYKTTNVNFSRLYISYSVATEPNNSPYPWDANAAYMRPQWATDEAWNHILGALRANVGNTWDDYFKKMRSNLDYLASMGYVSNLAGAAWQMEVNNAIAPNGQPAVLVSGIDIGVAVRGGSIGLSRHYSSSLRKRFTSGIFGYGWGHGYDYSLQLVADQKLLYIHAPSGTLTYTYETMSGGVPLWTSTSTTSGVTLVENGNFYILTDKRGNTLQLEKTSGRILASNDTAGNSVTFEYNGNLLSAVRHSDGRSLAFTYSGELVSKITDDQGRNVSYTYANGQLSSVKDNVSGNSITYAYNAVGGMASRALKQIKYPDNTTLDYLYDSLGRVAAVSQNGNKQITTINYESAAVVSLMDAAGALTRTWYGTNGKPLAAQDALGGVTRFNYDTERGLLLSFTTPNGAISRIEYDANDNPITTVSPTGKITRFASDAKGLLSAFTDARGNTTRYNRDTKGNTVSIVYPDTSARTFAYDGKSQMTSATNRRGQNVTLEYDDFGRVAKRTYPDGREFSYSYNAKNQMLTAADTLTGTITFTYDDKERLESVVYPNGKSFTYQYDSIGRLAKRTSEDGFELRYSYGEDGNLLAVADKNGKEYVRYTFDADTGRPASARYGNYTKTNYAFDLAGRVTGISHLGTDSQPLESFAYNYNANYDIAQMVSSKGVTAYEYDGEHQLTKVTYPGNVDKTYAYDTVGNRVNAEGVAYATNKLNQYTQMGDTAFRYDVDGNLTKKGEAAYEYDVENRLVRIVRADASVWECKYDALGQRIEVTDRGVTKKFVFDLQGIGELSGEYDSGGSLLRRYVHAGQLVADELPGGTRRYYHADLQGSTRVLTNESGVVAGTADYTAWGATKETTGETTIFGYVGTYGVINDGDGMLFMKNRYYDSETGRFIQEDPIGLNGGDVNLYRYCRNDGVAFVDYEGFSCILLELPPVLLGSNNPINISRFTRVPSGYNTNRVNPVNQRPTGNSTGNGNPYRAPTTPKPTTPKPPTSQGTDTTGNFLDTLFNFFNSLTSPAEYPDCSITGNQA
jgi:RHS repeat-associated protein